MGGTFRRTDLENNNGRACAAVTPACLASCKSGGEKRASGETLFEAGDIYGKVLLYELSHDFWQKMFSRRENFDVFAAPFFYYYIPYTISAETDNCDKQSISITHVSAKLFYVNSGATFIFNMLQYNHKDFPFPS